MCTLGRMSVAKGRRIQILINMQGATERVRGKNDTPVLEAKFRDKLKS